MITCYKIAVGVMGIDPEYFLHKMSMEGFSTALEGYNDNTRVLWTKLRIQCYWAVVADLENKDFKNFCISSMPFEWEDKEAVRKPTEQDTEKYVAILNEIINAETGKI